MLHIVERCSELEGDNKMTDTEKREASRQFYQKWVGRGKEDEDDRSYWLDLLARVFGIENATDKIEFQKKVIVDGHTKKIDAYIPETKVIIEQKTLGIDLDKKGYQSGGINLTPYEQAKRYNDNLPYDEKARWIVTSNFAEIWVYDMNMRVPEPIKIMLTDLQTKYGLLEFLINQEETHITQEMEISVKAGALVGIIYNALYKQYIDPESERAQKSLNMLCVRLVFCLYAEDAGVFGNNHHIFRDYLQKFNASDIRKALIELFHILDTKPEDRDPYDVSDLAKFPYVNGGLFADENIEIPHFTEEIKKILITDASDNFDWSSISPTIFGAVFESTLNPETRRTGGMHYTSIENIHKVIDPLFMNELNKEFDEIMLRPIAGGSRTKALEKFQEKLANLKFLDPACGSGNFLTETFLSLRRLENKVIKQLNDDFMSGQISLFTTADSLGIKVSISQFYGIEINDFAVTVAKTALWIAESQMLKETEDIMHMSLDFLPLKTNANIVEENALQINWNDIVSKKELSYIMGNPPFIGARQMDKDESVPKAERHQKKDMVSVFGKLKGIGNLDYVSAWYKLASDYITGTDISVAFVSTNSITQGEQPGILWKLLGEEGVKIQFAHRTFQWDSEAHGKAHVHCVIIGFNKRKKMQDRILIEGSSRSIVDNINAYLLSAPDIYITKRTSPICNAPEIKYGSFALDDGNYTISQEEYEVIEKKHPEAIKFIRPFIGAYEMMHNIKRYCIWLKDVSPAVYGQSSYIMERVRRVKEWRSNSLRKNTCELALTPAIFAEIRQPNSNYLAIPTVCSSKRRYLPIKYLSEDIIASNQLYVIPNATLYEFGVLMSNIHNAWIRAIGGRLKSDLRYSSGLIYNNFPWPTPTIEQRKAIELSAQGILDVYKLYSDCALEVLFDDEKMTPEMSKALKVNNKAVMQAYGFSIREMSEEKCVIELMKMYETLISK